MPPLRCSRLIRPHFVNLSCLAPQMYRSILTISYESLTKGGVTKLRNVMMELRKVVGTGAGWGLGGGGGGGGGGGVRRTITTGAHVGPSALPDQPLCRSA